MMWGGSPEKIEKKISEAPLREKIISRKRFQGQKFKMFLCPQIINGRPLTFILPLLHVASNCYITSASLYTIILMDSKELNLSYIQYQVKLDP